MSNKPDIGVINTRGPEGNIFFILAKAGRALPANLANEMQTRVKQCDSYTMAKSVIAEYVNVTYI